ncbi:hypothetical protein DFH09DRAFT_1322373 [Mycena vulgaris]|nr:hypothetical protein DFH09DRAFT_1322373 [Mycena vulgaris]
MSSTYGELLLILASHIPTFDVARAVELRPRFISSRLPHLIQREAPAFFLRTVLGINASRAHAALASIRRDPTLHPTPSLTTSVRGVHG